MSEELKRMVPTGIIFVIGVLVMSAYFTGNSTLNNTVSDINSWAIIIISFSLTVALIRMVYSRGRNLISMKQGEWYYSAIFLVVLFVQLVLGLVYGTSYSLYQNIWGIMMDANSAMSATTALFIISSAYRVFRARNKEALVLMIVAVLVMIGQTTMGEALWSGFPAIRNWVWDTPAAGAMRGITIVTAVGLVALTLRIMVGITKATGEASAGAGQE
jgi:hypothetical protein